MQADDETRRTPGSVAELLQIALPLIVSSGSLTLMHVVDRIFLMWYSTDALAAAMPAGLLHWTVISLAMGIATYANTFVSQYDGANRKDRVAAAVWQGVYLALIAGAGLLIFVPFSVPIFAVIGHEAAVQQMEASYFGILCVGSLPMILAAVLSCFFSGRGRTAVVMWVSIAGALINVGLDYCLIFGFGPFPSWGIRGAATATVLAQLVTLTLYVLLISRKPVRQQYRIWANRRFDRELFGRFVRYGFPNGMMFFVDIAGFALFILLVGQLGKTQLAATNLAFNLNALAFLPMLGVGTAVMILVGKRIGEGRPELAVRTTWIAFGLSGTYMLTFAAIYLIFPDVILAPFAVYTDSAEFQEIRNVVVVLLRFVAVFTFFDAMVIVFGSAIRGAGDTRFSLVFAFLACWLLMVLPTSVAWSWFGGSLVVSWSGCTAYIVVLGIGFLIRFQGGRWQSMRVIEVIDETESPAEISPSVSETVVESQREPTLTPAAMSSKSSRATNGED